MNLFLWFGAGGAGRRNKCGIAFGPSLTMLCTGGSCGQMISCWNWPPDAFQGNQVGGFQQRTWPTGSMHLVWCLMNCVQCVWFNGQFENMSQTHVEKRIRCNLKLILASFGAVWSHAKAGFLLILLVLLTVLIHTDTYCLNDVNVQTVYFLVSWVFHRWEMLCR